MAQGVHAPRAMSPLRFSSVIVLAMTSAVACAPQVDDELVGESQESGLTARSCGFLPTDRETAYSLRGRMNASLAATGMDPERIACARIITRAALSRGLGDKAAQVAIAASIADSGLYNANSWDGDRYGLFQQRVSRGVGRAEQLVDPLYATNAFFDAMLKKFGNTWQALPIGVVAAGTQGVVLPFKYEREAANAILVFDVVRGTRCANAQGFVVGAIEDKYLTLGGCGSILGAPLTAELPSPDRRGRYTVFENGSIYWRDDLGAFEVHGAIRDLWKSFGWETGALGYPLSDERTTPDGIGRYGVFQGGSIYWTNATGAHEVRGAIRDQWAALGWEGGALGYPIAGEVAVEGGVRSDFQHGSITWTRATGVLTVKMNGEAEPAEPAKPAEEEK